MAERSLAERLHLILSDWSKCRVLSTRDTQALTEAADQLEHAERVEKAARAVTETFGPDRHTFVNAPWKPKIRALRDLRAALESRP